MISASWYKADYDARLIFIILSRIIRPNVKNYSGTQSRILDFNVKKSPQSAPPFLFVDGGKFTPALREVRAEGGSMLSPRCVGAAARRAGLSPLHCDAPISRWPVCLLQRTFTPSDHWYSEDFPEFLRTDSFCSS